MTYDEKLCTTISNTNLYNWYIYSYLIIIYGYFGKTKANFCDEISFTAYLFIYVVLFIFVSIFRLSIFEANLFLIGDH